MTPSNRYKTVADFSILTPKKEQPKKPASLFADLRKSGGRNNYGKMTVRHVGGGHRRKYRVIDFARDKREIPAKVASLEYDPNRTAYIALLNYADGEKRYILAPIGLKVGDPVIASDSADNNVEDDNNVTGGGKTKKKKKGKNQEKKQSDDDIVLGIENPDMPDENERKILLKSRNDNVFVKERNSSEGEAGNNRTKDIEKKELIESIHDQNGKNELDNKTPEQNTNDIIELGVEDEEKELSETQMEKQTDENVIALGIEDDNGDTEDDMDIEVDVQDLQNVQNVQNVQDLQKLSEDKSQKNGGNSTRFGDALIAYLDGNSF
jgi:hypothetical protein